MERSDMSKDQDFINSLKFRLNMLDSHIETALGTLKIVKKERRQVSNMLKQAEENQLTLFGEENED
jgi:hypothetical protein